MFLRCTKRQKDGRIHRYRSLAENQRVSGGTVGQHPLLYLGEITDSQWAAWRKTIGMFQEGQSQAKTLALFPEDNAPALNEETVACVRLGEVRVERPRQWGACWLACELYGPMGAAGTLGADERPAPGSVLAETGRN